MNEVEYPPYSVSDLQEAEALLKALLKSESKDLPVDNLQKNEEANIENYYMIFTEVATLKALRDSMDHSMA
jgi:hypothetical protein